MNLAYMYCQSVTLLHGQAADVLVEYNENKNKFIVTATSESWIDNIESFINENDDCDDFLCKIYNINNMSDFFKEAREVCTKISGEYFTLREINQTLEKYCEDGGWDKFSWRYKDGGERIMLNELMNELTNENYYMYKIAGGGFGIVKANTEDSAKREVLNAYHKHGQPELTEEDVTVLPVISGYFSDSPNVIELGDILE